MSIVAFIPARGGSERIPRKNIRELNGHPLLAYAIAGAKKAGIFDGIYVSSEDEEILEVAEDYGVNVIKRPGLWAKGGSKDWDWINHALGCVWPEVPIFFILRPTNPFRTSKTIQRAKKEWRRSQADSLRAVSEPRAHPHKTWELRYDENYMEDCLKPYAWGVDDPTQLLPKVYIQNGCLQIHRADYCIKNGHHTGRIVQPFFTEGYEGLDLNDETDWILAEALIERGLAKLEEI